MYFDIIIVGGGIVGLTQALMLAQETSLSIAVLEKQSALPHWSHGAYHHRVSAVTLSSKYILEHLQIWPSLIEKRFSPFTGIKIHSPDLHFDAREINENYLGFIIENNLLHTALYEKIKTYPQITLLTNIELQQLYCHQHYVELTTHQKNFKAKLAIAADGAASLLRELAGIQIEKHDYAECAIVTHVETERSHEEIAQQIFLKSGPLAFLPLASSHLSSIVWTLPNEAAKEIIQLSKELFQEKLNKHFPYLGKIISTTDYHLFPLSKQKAKRYIHERVVLIGDAAHTIHPLAGLGVNMGILDAAALLDVIVDAIEHYQDFSSSYYLRRYERWRRADNTLLMSGIDIIKTVFSFSSSSQAIQNLLSTGFQLTHYFPWLKNIFSRYATGKKSDLPSLARKFK